jgi:hypothetical protein
MLVGPVFYRRQLYTAYTPHTTGTTTTIAQLLLLLLLPPLLLLLLLATSYCYCRCYNCHYCRYYYHYCRYYCHYCYCSCYCHKGRTHITVGHGAALIDPRLCLRAVVPCAVPPAGCVSGVLQDGGVCFSPEPFAEIAPNFPIFASCLLQFASGSHHAEVHI